jgi:hypothetical protein
VALNDVGIDQIDSERSVLEKKGSPAQKNLNKEYQDSNLNTSPPLSFCVRH